MSKKFGNESEISDDLTLKPKLRDNSVMKCNIMCEVCGDFGPGFLRCIYCNVVCHEYCYKKLMQGKENKFRASKNWICFYCEDSLSYDQGLKKRQILFMNSKELFNQSQVKIAACWRRYYGRKEYLKLYSVIVRIQLAYRIRLRKRQFLLSGQKKLRTIKLKIGNVSNIRVMLRDDDNGKRNDRNSGKQNAQVYVLISVHDFGGACEDIPVSHQTWKIESSLYNVQTLPETFIDIPIDERFVLAGVSGFQTIIISLFQKNNVSTGRDIFLGQTAVDMSKNNLWKSGERFMNIPLEGYEYDIMETSNRPIKIDSNFFDTLPLVKQSPEKIIESRRTHIRLNGVISFEVITSTAMNALCLPCFGSFLDDYARDVRKLIDQTGFTIPINQSVASFSVGSPKSTRSKSKSTSSSKFVSKVKTLQSGKSFDNSSIGSLSPDYDSSSDQFLNNISDIAETWSPTKSVDSSISSNSNKPQQRASQLHQPQQQPRQLTSNFNLSLDTSPPQETFSMRKQWICITDEKLYLFSHFGGPLKLIIDLQYFQVSFDFNPENICNLYGMSYSFKTPRQKNNNNNNSLEINGSKISERNHENIILKLSRRNGAPTYQFYASNEKDIFPLKCVFFTTLRTAKGLMTVPGLPVSTSGPVMSISPAQFEKKIDINSLLQDLIDVEESKAKRFAALMEAPMKSKKPSNSLLPSSSSSLSSLSSTSKNGIHRKGIPRQINSISSSRSFSSIPATTTVDSQETILADVDSEESEVDEEDVLITKKFQADQKKQQQKLTKLPSLQGSSSTSALPPPRSSRPMVHLSSSDEEKVERTSKLVRESASKNLLASHSSSSLSSTSSSKDLLGGRKKIQSFSSVYTSKELLSANYSSSSSPPVAVLDPSESFLSIPSLQYSDEFDNLPENDRGLTNEHFLSRNHSDIFEDNERGILFDLDDEDEDDNFSVIFSSTKESSSINKKPITIKMEKSISLPSIPSKKQSQSKPSLLSSASSKGKMIVNSSSKRLNMMERIAQKEKLQQEIMDQIVAEEMLADEKFQKFGEDFIQSIYARAADRKIKQELYRSHTFQPSTDDNVPLII